MSDYAVTVLLCIDFKYHRNTCFVIFQYFTNKCVFSLLDVSSFLVQANIKEGDQLMR